MELTKHENIGTVASSIWYSAFPFTHCRGVFNPLKICLIPLNLKRVVYCFAMGLQKKKKKKKKKRENRADLHPVSKCSGNPDINSSAFNEFPSKPELRKKNVFIYRIPLQSDVPVHKMSALVPSRVPRYQTESVPVETFKNCWVF